MPLGALEPVGHELVRRVHGRFAGLLVMPAPVDHIRTRLTRLLAPLLRQGEFAATFGDQTLRGLQAECAHAAQGFERKAFHWNIPLNRSTAPV